MRSGALIVSLPTTTAFRSKWSETKAEPAPRFADSQHERANFSRPSGRQRNGSLHQEVSKKRLIYEARTGAVEKTGFCSSKRLAQPRYIACGYCVSQHA